MNQDYKGIICNNYILFANENKKVRELSQVSYRILSFIIYSNIFFNYILGYINGEEILEKQLIPYKEEIFKGEFTGKDNDSDDSAGNWESYRIEILNKRKTPRQINDIIIILKTIWELLNNSLNNQNITNIHCFMNIIFTPLNQLIKKIQKR